MLLNQALENEQYDYLFDRSVELGDDTVAIDRKYIGAKGKTLDDVTASAKKSGYTLTYESDKVCKYRGLFYGRTEKLPYCNFDRILI